ncbi:MAG: LysR family transcriptional regulator [Pseudomonadota bacterium]
MRETADIYLFRDLERLSQTGNFSQAAERNNLSQSAFSRRIQALEAWVGVTLVDRSRQPVRLTAAGAQMLEAGLQALARIEAERSQILETQSLPDKYVVTFSTQHSIGWRFFPSWLQELEESYGPILSRLKADDLSNCLRDLREGSVDFVIAYVEENRTDPIFAELRAMERVTIGRDRLIPVSKPDKTGAPVFSFDDGVAGIPYLRFGDSAPISRHLEALIAAPEVGARLRPVYENAMAGALRIRARDGAGVAWLPESLVAPDLAAGALVRTGRPGWEVDLQIALLREESRSNRLTRSIWSFLEARDTDGTASEA